MTEHYDSMNYHRVLMKTLHFATTEISSLYFTWAKDRCVNVYDYILNYIYFSCDNNLRYLRNACEFLGCTVTLKLVAAENPVFTYLIKSI